MSTKKRGFWWWLLRIGAGLIGLVVVGLLGTTVNASVRDGRIYNADLPVGSQLIDVNGRNIHVYAQGEDQDGPAVVFVGCFGCNSAIWQAVQPGISQFAHTIAFDPAGYAWSDPGPGLMPQTMADDLFATLTALGEKEIILVGFSAGMLPIYDFYERYGSEINVVGMVSVEGAILADMEGDWYPPTNPLGLSGGMTDFLIATGVARLLAIQFQGPMPDTVVNVDYYRLVAESARTRQSLHTWASQYTPATHDDVQRVLSTAQMPVEPVVIVLQSQDILDTSDAMPGYEELSRTYAEASVTWYEAWTAAAAPGSQVIVVPNTTHFIMSDQPQAVIDAVRLVWE
jgi:pimeloyl-ACP methyl ester carboxylesterase